MLEPTPELPDDMPLSDVELSTRIRNVLEAAGLKSVGGRARNIRRNTAELPGPWGKAPLRIFARPLASPRQMVRDL